MGGFGRVHGKCNVKINILYGKILQAKTLCRWTILILLKSSMMDLMMTIPTSTILFAMSRDMIFRPMERMWTSQS